MFQKCMTNAILKHAVDRGNDAQMSVNTGIGNVYLLPFVNILLDYTDLLSRDFCESNLFEPHSF